MVGRKVPRKVFILEPQCLHRAGEEGFLKLGCAWNSDVGMVRPSLHEGKEDASVSGNYRDVSFPFRGIAMQTNVCVWKA